MTFRQGWLMSPVKFATSATPGVDTQVDTHVEAAAYLQRLGEWIHE